MINTIVVGEAHGKTIQRNAASDVISKELIHNVRLRLTKIRCADDDALSQVEGLQV